MSNQVLGDANVIPGVAFLKIHKAGLEHQRNRGATRIQSASRHSSTTMVHCHRSSSNSTGAAGRGRGVDSWKIELMPPDDLRWMLDFNISLWPLVLAKACESECKHF